MAKNEKTQETAPASAATPAERVIDGRPFSEIKAALLRNRGGHEQSDDDALLRLWRSLPAEAQTKYLSEPAAPADTK